MIKVRCFACNQLGHYVGQCPNKKKKKQQDVTATIAKEEEFQTQFERECSLIGCCSTVETPSSDWYIDSGASSHMSGVREHFSDLRDPEIRLEIVLGDDTVVKAVEHGTISFQRECMPPLVFMDVLFVPRLKKNFVSVSSLHDRGLEVSLAGLPEASPPPPRFEAPKLDPGGCVLEAPSEARLKIRKRDSASKNAIPANSEASPSEARFKGKCARFCGDPHLQAKVHFFF
jgi:hypothetical protein